MIYMDCLKYGKGLLLASLIPTSLLILLTCSLPPDAKCWAFHLIVAVGSLLVLSSKLLWLRVLIIASFIIKFALVESLDERAGSMPVVSMLYAFILL